MRGAKTKHQLSHARQALERQFESDHEQKKGDAKLADFGKLFDVGDRNRPEGGPVLRQSAKAKGANQHARRDETEHRAYAQPMKHRHDDAGGDEEKNRFLVVRKMELMFQMGRLT